ncbi:osm1 [Symbiodinium microadriaticum]|nr:osm1 [Symbiodinium microadriaticum]
MTITYALIQMLEKVAEKTDLARIITKAKVFKLVTNGNACVGCVYEKGGINLQEFGPVILASGGFGADFTQDSLLAKYRPDLLHLPTTNGEHCTGDGIKMGEAIGAKTIDLEWVQVHPTGLVKPDDADAKIKFLAAEAHHSAPQFRELAFMGGKRQWGRGNGGKQQQPSSWSNNAGWRYWRGTWESPRASRSQERRYDQVELREDAEDNSLGNVGGVTGYLQAIQRSLTAAKRQDTKLRKLAEQRELRKKQWAQYEKDTILAFSKQKQAYEAELQRIDNETAEAIEAGNLSAAQVKAVVVGMTSSAAPRENTAMEAREAWATLWSQVNEPAPGAGFLREAMAAAAQGGLREAGLMGVVSQGGMSGNPSAPATAPNPLAAFSQGPAPASGFAPDQLHADQNMGFGVPPWASEARHAPTDPVPTMAAGPPPPPPTTGDMRPAATNVNMAEMTEEMFRQELAKMEAARAAAPPGLEIPAEQPTVSGLGPGAFADPYITSPAAGRGPHVPSPGPKRLPIKQKRPATSVQVTGPSLSEKLGQKRSAIHPFGLVPGHASASDAPGMTAHHVFGMPLGNPDGDGMEEGVMDLEHEEAEGNRAADAV